MSAEARDLSESHGQPAELSAVLTAGFGARLAPFNPVTPDVVDAVIGIVLPALDPADLLVDIGSGDGRFLLAVRQRQNCLVAGVELSTELHEKAEERKCGASAHVRDGVFLYNADACAFDFKGALPRPPTVLFAYLVPEGFRLLASTLVELLLWMNASRSTSADRRSMLVTYMFSLPTSSSYCIIESATGAVDVPGIVLLHSKYKTSRGMPMHTYTLVSGERNRDDSCCPRDADVVLAPKVGDKASSCPRPEPVDPGCAGLV